MKYSREQIAHKISPVTVVWVTDNWPEGFLNLRATTPLEGGTTKSVTHGTVRGASLEYASEEDIKLFIAKARQQLEGRYEDFVQSLLKPGADILSSLTPEKCNLWHMGTGFAGEAGELLDAVKKYVVYEKEIDRENIIEELGDSDFFKTAIMTQLGITQEEIETHNREKLAARYNKLKYSNADAQLRADKQ